MINKIKNLLMFSLLMFVLQTSLVSASPIFVSKFGTFGTSTGQISSPTGITRDSSGNIYVADVGNHKISKFDSAGVFISSFGTFGTGDGQLDYPVGMHIDALGNLYVAEMLNHRVQKFDSAGNFLLKFGTFGSGDGQFNRPRDVFVDAAGNIYVTDGSNQRVQKFSSTGTFISKFGTPGTGPGQMGTFAMGIELDSTGNIYVATFGSGSNRISKYTNAGVFISQINSTCPANNNFFQMYITATNDLYVTEVGCHRIAKYDSAGVFQYSIGGPTTAVLTNGKFASPHGLVLSLDEQTIYVTDTGNHQIQVFKDVPPTVTGPSLLSTYNDLTPITGACVASSTVTVSVNGTVISPAGTCVGATYSITPTAPFALGLNPNIVATQTNLPVTNPVGLRSSTSTINGSITILVKPLSAPDITALTDTGTSSTDNTTNNTTPTFTGICTTGETVTLLIDNVAITPTQVCAAGVYTITPSAPISQGPHTVKSRFNTGAEISPASPVLPFYIDIVAPTNFDVVQNTSGPYSFTNPQFTFNSTDDTGTVTYTLSEDGGAFVPVTSGYVPVTPIDITVPHTYIFRACDQFNNCTNITKFFYPVITIVAPITLSSTTITNSVITITEPAASVEFLSFATGTVNGTIVTLNCVPVIPGAGNVKVTNCTVVGGIGSVAGDYNLVVSAVNTAGSPGQSSKIYTIDTTAPAITINAPTTTSTGAPITDTTVTVTDPNGVKDIILTGGTLGTCTPTLPTAKTSVTVVCTVIVINSGTVGVTVSDLAGNKSTSTQPGYVFTPPVVVPPTVTPEPYIPGAILFIPTPQIIPQNTNTTTTQSPVQNQAPGSYCSAYLLKDIVLGSKNDVSEVNKLINFLNSYEGEALKVDGTYDQDDFLAVKKFQTKYLAEIIKPWGGNTATGIVSTFTRGKINVMYCAKTKGLSCPYFTEYQKKGSKGGDVIKIKNFLNLLMGAGLPETDNYDQATFNAVKTYQELYRETVLKPWGSKVGTGWWYQSTRFSSNRIVGCDEINKTLDNGTVIR